MWLSKISGLELFSEFFRLREHGFRLLKIPEITFATLKKISSVITYINHYGNNMTGDILSGYF